jgi:hypothetical membrane protein
MTKDSEDRNYRFVRLAGFFGVLGAILPQIMVLSATTLSSHFSWGTNALSDLGVGPQAALFNGSLLLGGTLNFLFAFGLWRYLKMQRKTKAGIIALLLGSISVALVGIFTIDFIILHSIAALGYFVLAPLGMILIGSGAEAGAVKKVSLTCGTAAFMAILVVPIIVFGFSLKVGFAVPEEMEVLIIAAWTLFMSSKLLRAL